MRHANLEVRRLDPETLAQILYKAQRILFRLKPQQKQISRPVAGHVRSPILTVTVARGPTLFRLVPFSSVFFALKRPLDLCQRISQCATVPHWHPAVWSCEHIRWDFAPAKGQPRYRRQDIEDIGVATRSAKHNGISFVVPEHSDAMDIVDTPRNLCFDLRNTVTGFRIQPATPVGGLFLGGGALDAFLCFRHLNHIFKCARFLTLWQH